jgi:riboflavin kinase/FMN adenylyltransferase
MQHYRSLDGVQLQHAWLTIGSFDGVHKGHQEVVRRLVAGAKKAGSPAVVLTFFPHPAIVLKKRQKPFYLTTPDERAGLLGELGVDVVVTHPFNLNVSQLSALDFMEKINSHLDLSHLCIGHDFALGRNREGDIAKLRELGGKLDYEVEVVLPIKYEGEVISSSKIRADLANGDINHANKLLGRPYQLSGEVVAGDGRGKTIGIPTANLAVWEERAIPKAGVYVSRANVNGVNWAAITNVGYRPTFEKQISTRMVETHILNFDSDIYGQEVRLEFITYLREEQRFDSVDALVEQIRYDISQVGEYLD